MEEKLGVLNTSRMQQKIPQSLYLYDNPTGRRLEQCFWDDLGPDCQLLAPDREELKRPLTSYNHETLQDVLQMVSEWREEARLQVTGMSNRERGDLISTCLPDYSELRESIVCQLQPASVAHVNSNTSAESIIVEDSVKGYPQQSNSSIRRSRKHKTGVKCYTHLHGKKVASRAPNRRVYTLSKCRWPRHFAGPASLRRREGTNEDTSLASEKHYRPNSEVGRRGAYDLSSRCTSTRSSLIRSSPPRRVPPKLARLWKSLVKKVVCKCARQRITWRKDKITLAKRAARECTRVLRQRALLSQKSARDSLNRAHRLAREIAQHWRSSAFQAANGSSIGSALVVNGTPISSAGLQCTALLASSTSTSLFKSSCDGDGVGGPELLLFIESAAAARRRAEKAAAEQRKADLELLEARRQQRKLNFLLTQTELYAHFMSRKLNSERQAGATPSSSSVVDLESASSEETALILRRLDDSDGSDEEGEEEEVSNNGEVNESGTAVTPVSSSHLESADGDAPKADQAPSAGTRLETSAKTCLPRSSIAAAARAAAYRLGVGDAEEDINRLKSQALSKVKNALEVDNMRRMNLPSTGAPAATPKLESATQAPLQLLKPPSLFHGQLKGYQLLGLNWLSSLFDQGINGILADEMGLGKTIQTIAFLGHLAETYDIWGPFLIITPASTLHNWTQEFAKFLPAFRLVPYWGSPAERKVLRRFWSGHAPRSSHGKAHSLDGRRESEMHVVVTSYQVVLQDSRFIGRTAWSYIVLDEAHAIKSTSSLRWKVLLSFSCRNRLLLTGTPIQNTMQELWALLHFIMPSLFDSHDEFATWFSKDIESHAAATTSSSSAATSSGFSTSKLDENQLSRLRLILKPFMLRRTKVEVEHEISAKTEIMLYCPLSTRQQRLYDRLRTKIRLEDLSSMIRPVGSGDAPATGAGDSFSPRCSGGPATTAHLINLVMQLRKVCNHPDLRERREVTFACISGGIRPSDTGWLGYQWSLGSGQSVCLAPIPSALWSLPRLLVEHDLLPEVTGWGAGNTWPVDRFSVGPSPGKVSLLLRRFAIFRPDHIHVDLWRHDLVEPDLGPRELDSIGQSPAICLAKAPEKCFSFLRLMGITTTDLSTAHIGCWDADGRIAGSSLDLDLSPLPPNSLIVMRRSWVSLRLESILSTHLPSFLSQSIIPKVLLLPVKAFVRRPFFLFPATRVSARAGQPVVTANVNSRSSSVCVVASPMPSFSLVSPVTRIADSGKLTALDRLLSELKADGHRVLIYSQMTRMIDILEEFMLHRRHAYLRLDGSSRLSDRRDMVANWQSDPRWFVFLLSTRAGGLGINLTAADTVIFYDSDWNPTVDQQAMDRAHRLGQTKPVTVYRLICKNTVEGRMLQRAEEKRAMQAMVIQSGDGGGVDPLRQTIPAGGDQQQQLTSSDVVSLLLDDDELVTRLQVRRRQHPSRGRPPRHQPSSTASPLPPLGEPEGSPGPGSNPPPHHSVSSPGLLAPPGDRVLERKRQAAWANRPKGGLGRPKKIRALEPIMMSSSSGGGGGSANLNANK